MQLSDREIQNTLDLLKKSERMGGEHSPISFSKEEKADIDKVVRRIDTAPDIRKDRVDKVKKALESSSYNVTGDEVAKKLIGRIFSDKLD